MMKTGDADHRKPTYSSTGPLSRRRSWCCSFAVPPGSPEARSVSSRNHIPAKTHQHQRTKPNNVDKPGPKSVPCSPQSSKSALIGRIDPRRILSPGRVSPIDSDPIINTLQETTHEEDDVPAADSVPNLRSESFRAPKIDVNPGLCSVPVSGVERYDARLSLKGRNGGVLVLELSSEVLAANSDVFSALIEEKSSSFGLKKTCRIEVSDVENLGVFRETVELMFEESNGIIKKFMKMGVYRAIDVLEVASGIKFSRAVLSCLKYLEDVPWTEDEEEKLRRVLAIYNFDTASTSEILARFDSDETESSQDSLSKKLVWSITSCSDVNPRNELRSLVKGLLCKSSVYEKEQPEINKEDIYKAGKNCVDSLLKLFEEGNKKEKPLIECISREVENIIWLLEIMIDREIAEEFVEIWGKQRKLVEMHEKASPMVRYELSRVTGVMFIAMGKRKVQCGGEARAGLVEAWFRPMLVDFGWLQRCKKGLDMREVEEGMGQTLLTLPLKQQYQVFMEWFKWFSKHGSECPNLSKAFQIWWRRSFLRGVESSTCR
uniref:BTB/POZ domain-containing protein n=1 Tax=Noccaea caerulescens TaxID=107243 RepID=A0A1J3IJW0_NOCCA